MKKILGLLFAAVLLLGIFQLLGSGGISAENEGITETINICAVVPSEFGDEGFNDSLKEGIERLKEQFDIKLNTVECKNENYKQHLMTAAQDNDIVAVVGWQFSEIKEVAAEYPSTKFIWADNAIDDVAALPNVICITYEQDQGSFLAGYIAARLSQTNAVGVVGGDSESSLIAEYITGFEQGAAYANGGINVYKAYTDGYENSMSGQKCAEELYAKGVDVVFQVAGNSGKGVFKAAKESGFYAIGSDTDQKLSLPWYDGVIACSVKKDIASSVCDVISEYMESDDWQGGRECVFGIEGDYVSIAYGDKDSVQIVDNDTKRDVSEAAKQIASGKIKIENER